MRVMMHAVALALIYSLLQTVAGEVTAPYQHFKCIGETAHLGCTLQFKNAIIFNINWFKYRNTTSYNPGIMLTQDKFVKTSDARFSVTRNNDDNYINNYILNIEDVREADSGLYGCELVVIFNDDYYYPSTKVNLIVLKPPIITRLDNTTKPKLSTQFCQNLISKGQSNKSTP